MTHFTVTDGSTSKAIQHVENESQNSEVEFLR